MSKKATITGIFVATSILVGGYALVNEGPVKGMKAGNPFTNDDIKKYSVDSTTYISNADPQTVQSYEEISGINNRVIYESYTPTHTTTGVDGNPKYTRQHSVYYVDDLSQEEIDSYINEFNSNSGKIYVDGSTTETIDTDSEKGEYSTLTISKVNYDNSTTEAQTDEENMYDIRFAGTLGLASIASGIAAGTMVSNHGLKKEEKSKVKTKVREKK